MVHLQASTVQQTEFDKNISCLMNACRRYLTNGNLGNSTTIQPESVAETQARAVMKNECVDSTVSTIRKRSTKFRRIISREEIDDCRLKGICVFCNKPEIPEHYHKNARLFLIDGDEDQLSDDKELVEKEVESDSFLKSDLVHQRNLILGTKSMMDSDSMDDESCRTVKEIHEASAKDLEVMSSESIAVSLNDVESPDVVSMDSFPEIHSKQEANAHSVHQHAKLEAEVPISLLEPSHKIDEMQFVLTENSSSLCLCNDSRNDHRPGVLIAPKVEEAYILDVGKVGDLIQKSIVSVDFVAHQLSAQMLLRVCFKMNQRRYQKDWTFKYKLKKRRQHFCEKVFTEQEELQVVVSDNINDGFGWDNFCGFHEKLVSVFAIGENTVLTENVGPNTMAEVMSHWTELKEQGLRIAGDIESEYTRALHAAKEQRLQHYEKFEEKQCFSVLWKRLICKDWMFKFKKKDFTGTRPQKEHLKLVKSLIARITWQHGRMEVVSCWIAIPVTSLTQKRKERLIGLADTMNRREVGQDQVVYADLALDTMMLAPDFNLQKHLGVLWRHWEHWYRPRLQFVLLVADVAGILKKLLNDKRRCQEDVPRECAFRFSYDSYCIQWGLLRSQFSQENMLLRFVSGCMIEDMLQNLCTEMWLIVTARSRCDQRLMAFYEAVQNSWFPGVFCASNGTDSFSIWHRWRYRSAIALCAEQEVDKLRPLNEKLPSDFISSTGRSVFAGNIKTVSEGLVPAICASIFLIETELAETELKEVESCDAVLAWHLSSLNFTSETRERSLYSATECVMYVVVLQCSQRLSF